MPVGQPVLFAPTFIEQNRRLGYSQQWNFGIQREIGWGALVEATYLGNVGHKLNGPDTSINQVPTALMGAGNAQVRRPFPQFDTVSLIAPMWGNSSYHGLNVKVEKRFSHGLNFLANYSFSKFIDDVPAAVRSRRCEHGDSEFLRSPRGEIALRQRYSQPVRGEFGVGSSGGTTAGIG